MDLEVDPVQEIPILQSSLDLLHLDVLEINCGGDGGDGGSGGGDFPDGMYYLSPGLELADDGKTIDVIEDAEGDYMYAVFDHPNIGDFTSYLFTIMGTSSG